MSQVNSKLQKVPEAYKQSEVGMIPVDWEVKPLATLLLENPRYGIGAAAVLLTGNLPVYLRITDISDDGYFAPTTMVGVDRADSENYVLQVGDLVFARTGASVGKSYMYRESDGKLVYAGFLIKISPNPTKLLPSFLFQYVKTRAYWDFVHVMSMRSGQPGINGAEYGQLLVPLPNPKEQTAIANALSDVDALITSLEKLIDKKRAIKTAAMQQLLTGKKRLPPFDKLKTGYKKTELGEIPGDWEVKPLGKLCSYQNGTAQEQYFNGHDGYKVISIGNYSENGKFISTGSYIDKSHNQIIKKFILNKGDLTMILNDKTAVGTIIGRVLLIDKDNEYVMNQRTMRLISNGYVSSEFLYFLINSNFVHKSIMDLAKPGTQIYINTDDVTDLPLGFPVDPIEQKSIVEVLKNMDDELNVLGQRLNKTQQIKQGMMQELLTGRTRLI